MSPMGGAGTRASASLLVVCTGNICRSPAAEFLLRAGLDRVAGMEVASAGLRAVVGASIAPQMAERLRERGIDPAGWTASQLDPAEVRSADVVLTMTAEQRAAVVARTPTAVRRTFTLREFADLARLSDPGPAARPADRLTALVAAAPQARARRAAQASLDDIDDPFGREDAVFDRVLAEIDTAVGTLLDVLTPTASHAA
jgi:protein-tyrosine phosphatase